MSADAPRLPPPPGLEGVPIISEDVELNDLSESQLVVYVRQAKDAHSHYFPEGRVPLVQTDRAMILLAKNVTDTFFERRFLPIKARYLLDENQDLYIRKTPGQCHSRVSAQVCFDCGNWTDRHGLRHSVDVAVAGNKDYDGKKLEPDVAISSISDGLKAAPRCVIEVEVNHRSPREARELAAVYFRDPNVGAVVLLKVWDRRQNGTFAAACIVWVRPDDEEGVHFGCVAAYEFGTAPMTAQARNNLSGANPDPPLQIPFVPAHMVYTLPEPGHPIDGRVAQIVRIPALPIIVNATNEHGVQLVDVDPPIRDLELNLSMYLKLINRSLPPSEPVVGGE
jgi:hypothetical protein